jgi:hypothetical protein
MSLSLLQVVAAVRARRASLSAETVGYLLLGVSDHAVAAPREIGAADVLLGEEGAVKVGAGKIAAPDRTERALRELLEALLSVASTATPALLRIGRRQTAVGVEALVRELEAALIPVNRSAARRALTRLYRDTLRAAQAGPLDIAAAQAWLQRAMAPSVPAPAVVSEPNPPAAEPMVTTVAVSEVPVEVVEISRPTPIPATRPPPLPAIEERPEVESLTRPEPALVRAAVRARAEVREQLVEPAPSTGTPRLGTFAARAVLPPPLPPSSATLFLTADEATDRMPDVFAEPVVPLVKTAPLFDVVTAPVSSDELSADLASVVTNLVTSDSEPVSPVAPAVEEPVRAEAADAVVAEQPVEQAADAAALEPIEAPAPDPLPEADGEFQIDDEIVIVVDEDLEAFEPEAVQAPDDDYLVTRWWSSPDPPALAELAPEPAVAVEEPAPAAAAESVGAELPVVPELELPPLPEYVAWATPEPPLAQVAAAPEPEPASVQAEAAESGVAPWPPQPSDDAYLDLWESASNDDTYFDAWELDADGAPDLVSEAPPRDDADFEAAAAAYAPLESDVFEHAKPVTPVAEPVGVERRILSLPATDYSEVGWTPAPEPGTAGEAPPACEAPQAPEPPPQAPEPPPQAVEPATPELAPEPDPAPPRFAPRKSDVSELLRGFAVTEARSDRELCRDLKTLAGVDLTPAAPRVRAAR